MATIHFKSGFAKLVALNLKLISFEGNCQPGLNFMLLAIAKTIWIVFFLETMLKVKFTAWQTKAHRLGIELH